MPHVAFSPETHSHMYCNMLRKPLICPPVPSVSFRRISDNILWDESHIGCYDCKLGTYDTTKSYLYMYRLSYEIDNSTIMRIFVMRTDRKQD